MPQALAYTADGQPIPEAESAEAVAAGRANFVSGAPVYMRDPATGKDVAMPAENAARAAADGFMFLAPEYVAEREREASRRREFGEGLAPLQAAAEGALRGATFGVSDQVLSDFGMREGLAARKELNPNAALGGELAGTIAPLLLSGGSGALARGAGTLGGAPIALSRGAQALERGTLALLREGGQTTLGKLGARALGAGAAGAFEGAAYGAGQRISEAALTDTDLTAEKLLAGAGEGALFGGLTGGALGLVGGGASRLLRRADGESGAAGSLSERLGTFAERKAFKQIVGNSQKNFDAAMGFGGQARIDRIGRKLLDRSVPLADLSRASKGIAAEVADAGARMQTVVKRLDDAGQKVDALPLFQRIGAQLDELRSHKLGDYQKIASKLEKKIAPLRALDAGDLPEGALGPARAPQFSFEEFWQLRRDLDKTINWAARKADPATDSLRQLRTTFDEVLTDAVEKSGAAVGDDAISAWRAAKEDYSDFVLAQRSVDEQLTRRAKNRALSPTDYGSGGVLGLATGLATGSVAAGALTSAVAGAAGATVHKFVRERGSGIVAEFANRLARTELRLDMAARKIAGAKVRVAPARLVVPTGAALRSRFDTARTEIEALDNPQIASRRLAALTDGIDRDQPALAGAMQQRFLEDAQYLRAQLPRSFSRAGSSLTPGAEKARVSGFEMRRFVRRIQALEDPVSVVEGLASGKLDRDQIETLKERRPRIFAAVREKVMVFAAQSGDALPYKQRIQLSIAFGFRGDPSLQPETLAAIQASAAPPPDEANSPSSRPLDPSVAADLSTPSQQAGASRA